MPSEEEARFALNLEIREVLLEDASVEMRVAGQDAATASLEGVNLRLENLVFKTGAGGASDLGSLAADGRIEVREAVLDGTLVREIGGDLEVAEGRFELPELGFTTDQGPFTAGMTVELDQMPIAYNLRLQGNPLDFHSMIGATVAKGLGAGFLELEMSGVGTDSKDVVGTGSFRLAEGKLPGGAILSAIEEVLGPTELIGAPYQASGAPIRIESNQVFLDRFRFETPQAGFDLQGSYDLADVLAFQLTLKTPRGDLYIGDLPPEVLDVLADDEGWILIPLEISGSIEEPKVRVDVRALKQQAKRGAVRVVTERAAEELLKLFQK